MGAICEKIETALDGIQGGIDHLNDCEDELTPSDKARIYRLMLQLLKVYHEGHI